MYGTFNRITKYFVTLICDENSEVGYTLCLIIRFQLATQEYLLYQHTVLFFF